MRAIALLRTVAALAVLTFSTACMATAQPRGVVYVRQGPPRALVDVRGVAPSRAHVWIPGFYAWRGGGYVWVAGRYDVIRPGFRRYEPGRWRHTRSGWYWTDGRWR
jgi:WXXGXW repeat (2 copies)